MAATNVASFGRRRIQTESTASNGHTQNQPGHRQGALIAFDRRYRHLTGGELGQPLHHPVGAADLRAVEVGCTAAERAVSRLSASGVRNPLQPLQTMQRAG
jgi:hypothetical protein